MGGTVDVECYHGRDHDVASQEIATSSSASPRLVTSICEAGFEHVEIVDSSSDLNGYAKVENQPGCCSPAMAKDSCCSPSPASDTARKSVVDGVTQMMDHEHAQQ